MKLHILLVSSIALLCISTSALAQDTLYMKDGSMIPAKVIEVNSEEIKYKRTDNPDGPLFISRKNEIDAVKYENGIKETIVSTPQKTEPEPVVNNTPVDLNVPIYRKGPFYKQGNYRMKEKEMQKIILNMNDREINYHVKKAKVAKGIQYIGFVAIPAFIFGLGYTGYALGSNYNTSTGTLDSSVSYAPGIAAGFVAAGALATSITFKSIRKKHNNAALKIYNEKY
ncbi:MAG: hypothetical protein M3R27_05090 [Bacteroidota bacterium]|nr:hypothetical protein [Bacteroidota bacterium]